MAVGTVAIPVWLGMLIIGNYGSQIMAGQVYSQDYSEDCDNFHAESSGYLCEGFAKECNTFALYRAQEPYTSLDSVGTLFNTDAATIASASNFDMTIDKVGRLFNTDPAMIANASNLTYIHSSKFLKENQPLLIPIHCQCATNYSQANLNYTVQRDDTYLKIANQTLEGLTTCQAMREQNPNIGDNDMETGMKLMAPLRCACPTRQQLEQGVKYLLSYIADVEDDDQVIASKFNIRHQDLISANGLEENNPTIYPYTTLLIPLNHTPTIPPEGPFAPPPPLVPSSPPQPDSNSRLFVVLISFAIEE
ncbi:hypothetical protein SUGI_0771110 [Cryptomeria japonica]|uniref:lysM domain receptor-like kinase 4 n=1 Tax=Cryptomeria japonica TaxID=3369 RepID=UPI002414B729|nr:lysM domain receptor-like kinase 4 [Cryptomeria japonica]GLJ37902.1 hypothetical protein SUGI_0771110 [Cryptomeria japonica]